MFPLIFLHPTLWRFSLPQLLNNIRGTVERLTCSVRLEVCLTGHLHLEKSCYSARFDLLVVMLTSAYYIGLQCG